MCHPCILAAALTYIMVNKLGFTTACRRDRQTTNTTTNIIYRMVCSDKGQKIVKQGHGRRGSKGECSLAKLAWEGRSEEMTSDLKRDENDSYTNI